MDVIEEFRKAKWSDFRLGEFFRATTETGKGKYNSKKVYNGNIPMVTKRAEDNGIIAYVSKEDFPSHKLRKNIITVGSNTGNTHFHGYECIVNFNCVILQPLYGSIASCLFFTAVIGNIAKELFNDNFTATADRLTELVVPLPVDDSGRPNYELMANYIAEIYPDFTDVEESLIDEQLRLSDREWQEFFVEDIFNIYQGKKWITKGELANNPGRVPLISNSGSNNGVMGLVNPEGLSKCSIASNVITVAVSGSAGATFYQGKPAVINSGVLILKGKVDICSLAYLFLTAVVSKACERFDYGMKASADRVSKLSIRLPITPTGDPDYDFMERYIKSLPFSSVIDSLQS